MGTPRNAKHCAKAEVYAEQIPLDIAIQDLILEISEGSFLAVTLDIREFSNFDESG